MKNEIYMFFKNKIVESPKLKILDFLDFEF